MVTCDVLHFGVSLMPTEALLKEVLGPMPAADLAGLLAALQLSPRARLSELSTYAVGPRLCAALELGRRTEHFGSIADVRAPCDIVVRAEETLLHARAALLLFDSHGAVLDVHAISLRHGDVLRQAIVHKATALAVCIDGPSDQAYAQELCSVAALCDVAVLDVVWRARLGLVSALHQKWLQQIGSWYR